MDDGSEVVVAGWASRVKDIGKVAFIHMRDREGSLQITVKSESPIFELIKDITPETVIATKGKMVKGKLKSGDMELVAEELEILSKAGAPLPLDTSGFIDSKSETRFDSRYMDLRRPELAAAFRIRSQISASIKEFMLDSDCIEVHTPKIAGAGAEGGATLFKVEYYGREAYLNQSQQLYKQMLMSSGFDKIFEIGPSFRAEKSHTRRHLSEFTQLDFEMAFIDDEEIVMDHIERMIVKALSDVKQNCKDELEILERDIEIPKIPFRRLAYEDALKLLEEKGRNLKFGDDIGTEDEKLVGDMVKEKYGEEFYFLTKWPYAEKPFYIMTDGEVSRGFDLEYNGDEMISGGQREHRYDVLVKQMEEKGLNPKDFDFYLDAFKHGCPPHGGFGMGMDRLVMKITGIENIREVNLFPRTPERVIP